MTAPYLKNISPDSITGMIMAMEGIANTVVLLNGPMGCKFYHSTTSQFLTIRPLLYVPSETSGQKIPVDYNYLNNYFFRQQQVPCTYLDGYDYVYGTRPKVRDALHFLKQTVAFDLLVIINSPGASLIGDNLKELADEEVPDVHLVMLESPGYSLEFTDGYESAVLELLRQVGRKMWSGRELQTDTASEHKPSVNILGLSIWDRYAAGDREEIRRMFALCGIEVRQFLAAESNLDQLKNLPEADMNVVLYPECGEETAHFLEEELGMPFYICELPPIGFSASEKMMREICTRFTEMDEKAAVSCASLIEESERSRALAWYNINNVYQSYGKPKGVRYAIDDTFSKTYGLARFLTGYLGMVPDSLETAGQPTAAEKEKMIAFLEEYSAVGAWEKRLLDTDAELVFGNANSIAQLKAKGVVFCGIETSVPGMGYIDLINKTQIGLTGALFLIEQVLNGLMSRL